MYVTVIKSEDSTAVLIVDSEDKFLAEDMQFHLRGRLLGHTTEKDFTQYESNDVVLTIDGEKVNN
jgi:hypothetical protein